MKPYYLGLDLGTNSIGWAATDLEYRVIKKGKKSMWGVRKFRTSEGAAARRLIRTARRRRKREKQRIQQLQTYFQPAIQAIDPGFFVRLKDSFFYPDDKTVQQPYALFNDPDFTDADYHKLYPTIYHLRAALMRGESRKDPRLVYLACHHIMRHRGHFYYEQTDFGGQAQFSEAANDLHEALRDIEFPGADIWSDETLVPVFEAIFLDRHIRKSNKIDKLQEQSPDLQKNKQMKEIFRLLLGYQVTLSQLFGDDALRDVDPKKVSYKEDYSEKRNALEAVLGERIAVLDALNELYAATQLKQLIGNFPNLSEAFVAVYDQHKADLKTLKTCVDQAIDLGVTSLDFKNRIFRLSAKDLNNYVAFSGHLSSGSHMKRVVHRCNETDFYDFLSRELRGICENTENSLSDPEDAKLHPDLMRLNEQLESILVKLESELFLPRIRSSHNGVIPQQLHASELKKILAGAAHFMPELTETVQQDIHTIFAFKIPYYIGPFDDRSRYAWIKRKTLEPITPLNFHEVVDEEASAEAFMKNLTNKCTYLLDQDVLPKESLLYSEFVVRNAINMLRIDGKPLDRRYRDTIFENLFLHRSGSGRVTKKRIVSCLKNDGLFIQESQLTGMDADIPHRLKARQDFERICAGKLTDSDIENLILKLTALPDTGELLKNWLTEQFGDRLSAEELKQILKLKYKDWGRLSKGLLNGPEIRIELPDGRRMTIIELMRTEALTLMEVLEQRDAKSGKTIRELINDHNARYLSEQQPSLSEQLDAYRLSPAVKKMVWQVLRLCDEIVHIMGGLSEKIFVEMARGADENQKGQRTVSRSQQLKELYKACEDELKQWAPQFPLDRVRQLKDDELRAKKLYLYCLQMGKCLYSGSVIDLDQLWGDGYDIDHIYPRSMTKDDSFSNLALVCSSLNRQKTDDYPIPSGILNKEQREFWEMLLNKGFMSREKFNRLTRRDPLTTEDINGFINRQLVETRQMTKVVGGILREQFGETTRIVYVKAGHVSDFRYNDGLREDAFTKFYFPKSRLINDFHHAKDAYLNIVVGNVYDTKFGDFHKIRTMDDERRKYNLIKLYDFRVETSKTVAWIPGDRGTIATVRKYMAHNDVMITYETYRQKGGFYDQMLVPKGSGIGKSPIKRQDSRLQNIERYGSFNKVAGSHFALIEYEKRGKRERAFVSVSILMHQASSEELLAYLPNEGYDKPRILVHEIKYSGLIMIDDVPYRLLGKTGSSIKCALGCTAHYSFAFEKRLYRLEHVAVKGNYEVVDDNELNGVFAHLVQKLGREPFASYSALKNQGINLNEAKDSFYELSKNEKIKTILQITQLLKGEGGLSDFSLLSFSNGRRLGSQSGMITISINVKKGAVIKVIHQSLTGYYEQIIEV